MKFKINQIYETLDEELYVSVYAGSIEVTKYLLWKYNLNIFSIDGVVWYTLMPDGMNEKLPQKLQNALKLHVNQEVLNGNLLELNIFDVITSTAEKEIIKSLEADQPINNISFKKSLAK